MKLTEADRQLLAVLGPDPRQPGTVAAVFADAVPEFTDTDAVAARLAALADNGLAERVEGGFRRTESGRRLLAVAAGGVDDAVDTSPAVERAIASTESNPTEAAAIRSVYAFLRYWGDATTDEILDAIYPERPAGYDSPDEWFDGPIAGALAAIPAVEAWSDDGLDRWRYTGRAEVETPASDGFLPAARRGHHQYGSVKHAIESLPVSPAERDAVRAAFGVLRRRETASETAIVTAAFANHPAGHADAETLWRECLAGALERLPGVSQHDDERWRYDLPPTE